MQRSNYLQEVLSPFCVGLTSLMSTMTTFTAKEEPWIITYAQIRADDDQVTRKLLLPS